MRQRGQFERHAQCRELRFDVAAPAARALESAPEPVPQSLLESDAAECGTQRLVADAVRPQAEYPRLFRGQVLALAAGEYLEHRLDLVSFRGDSTLTLAARQAAGHIDPGVHDIEVTVVVKHAFLGRVFGEDVDPELNVGLEFGWNGESLVGDGIRGGKNHQKQ